MLYQTSGFALGLQSAIETQALTFYRGRFMTSGAKPIFDQIDPSGEHTGIHNRGSALQSSPINSGFHNSLTMDGMLYPSLIPLFLLGYGFKINASTAIRTMAVTATGGTYTLTFNGQTTAAIAYNASPSTVQAALEALSNVVAGDVVVSGTAAALVFGWNITTTTFTVDGASLTGGTAVITVTTAIRHYLTLADADEESWLSILSIMGDDTDELGRVILDAKVDSYELAMDPSGLNYSASGLARSEGLDAGTEVVIQDVDALLNPSTGNFTLTSSDFTPATFGCPRTHTLTLGNPLDDAEQCLHTYYRSGFSPQGKVYGGSLGGMIFSSNAFLEHYYGSVSGTEPEFTVREAGLNFKFETQKYIGATAIPYSVEYNLDPIQVVMRPFDVQDGGQITWEAEYKVVDRAAASPIWVAVVNDIADYAV